MLGAVIGDIIGSRFEADNHKSKEFDLFTRDSCPTDDSVMTLAVARALLVSKEDWSQLSKKCCQVHARDRETISKLWLWWSFFSTGYFQMILNPMGVMGMALP